MDVPNREQKAADAPQVRAWWRRKKRPETSAPPVRRHVRVLRAAGRGARRIGWTVLAAGLLTLGMTLYGIARTPVIGPVSGPTVNDVTQLNEVARVIAPATEAETADGSEVVASRAGSQFLREMGR